MPHGNLPVSRDLLSSCADILPFTLQCKFLFPLCQASVHLFIGKVNIESFLCHHFNSRIFKSLCALNGQRTAKLFFSQLQCYRNARFTHTVFTYCDGFSCIDKKGFIGLFIEVMNIVTETSFTGVKVSSCNNAHLFPDAAFAQTFLHFFTHRGKALSGSFRLMVIFFL